MSGRRSEVPITDSLRKTIKKSGTPLLTLEQKTGVKRASIMRFVRHDQSLRLDLAERLATYYDLELTRRKAK